ncbi:MAG TPA: hypothetical protein VH591_16825 [Ktedonobacterales bacterium]
MATPDPSSQPTTSARWDGRPLFRAIRGVAGRPANAAILRFAGNRYLRNYGVVHHRGRRSGRPYATPVVVQPTTDGFVIPLAFGEGTDWFQNLRAANGCVIRWNGRNYAVADPVVIDLAAARPLIGWFVERLFVPLVGAKHFVHARHIAAPSRDTLFEARESR